MMTLYTGGFSRFIASTAAPIATDWSENRRAGFAPAGKPCLCTAHMTNYANLITGLPTPVNRITANGTASKPNEEVSDGSGVHE